MKSIFKAQISFLPYASADDSEIENISLGAALVSRKWRKLIEAVRAEQDPQARQALKDKLPCITPGGTFGHVCRAGLIKPSGFLCADLDYKPEKGINTALAGFDLKAEISRLPYVAYCGHSCSGAGYFLIIPIKDPAKYKDYYRALSADFEKGGLTLDPACSNIAFKRFVSYDDNPYINTAARPYSYTLPEREHTTREALGRELDASEAAAKVEAVIKACELNKWDITESYADWVRLLSALASTFGEAGRDYAHRISALYGGYDYQETESKFNDLLRHPEYKTQIGTFFYIARQEIGKHDFDIIANE